MTLYGRSESSLARGMDLLAGRPGDLRRTRSSTDGGGRAEANIAGTTDLDGAARQAEWVIESIAEDLAVKQELVSRGSTSSARGRRS